ncbi:MAG: metallophosphoesterase [Anaeromyxobacter sp.]
MPRTLSILAFLAVALGIVAGMHWYLWARLVRDPGLGEPWRRLATVLVVLLAIAVPAGMFAVRIGSGWVQRFFPIIAFSWLGVCFILCCAVAAFDLARLAAQGMTLLSDWLRSQPEAPADPARRAFVARVAAGGALLAGGGATALAFRSATGPAQVEEVPVKLERLPRALSGYTIAQISDLHVGPLIQEREVRRVVEQTNGLRPDLIAITGDLVDGSVEDLGRYVDLLGRLQARHGVWFVTGNHDYYSGADAWVAKLRQLGFRVLRNQRATIGEPGASFELAGVEDYGAARDDHPANIATAFAGRDPEKPLVLLAHQPRGVEAAVAAGADLQLSGHTHGGQIIPFNLLVAASTPYVRGLHTHVEGERRGQIYVHRGTGFWGPPMRLGSPPEIAKLVLV